MIEPLIPTAVIEAIYNAQQTCKATFVYMDQYGRAHSGDYVPGWCEEWWEVFPDGDVTKHGARYWQ